MKVKCIRGFGDNKYKQGILDKALLELGKIYEVALIIKKGKKPNGEWDSGYIIINKKCPFPYIWDNNRFEIIERE